MPLPVTQIKIKLPVPKPVIDYAHFQEQWENEGGSTTALPAVENIHGLKLPFQAGDCFQVLHTTTDIEDDEMIYIADIQKLPM